MSFGPKGGASKSFLKALEKSRRPKPEFPRDALQELYGSIEEALSTFETGPGHFPGETGFYHLPSGQPMKASTVAARFERIAKLANKAVALLSNTVGEESK